MRKIDYEKELNPEQLKVVFAGDGPMLIIAGAGSGKTRTLTYKVARLIEGGVKPERILLATFTNKAAREMLSRVENLVGVDTGRLWGGTFHHLGNRVLRRHAPLLGYMAGYSILDDEDAAQLINACVSDLNHETKGNRFPKGRVLADIFSYAANTGESVEGVVAKRYPYFFKYTDEIIEVAGRYSRKKRGNGLMDFDDLLLNWRDLLREHPEVSKAYGEQFEHILVDEYQDTNLVQAEIVDLLAKRRNLTAVGDDSQSIYSFRGANFANILRFPEKYPDARIFKLETNYRSTPEILHLANRSIRHNEEQFHKVLRAVKRPGNRPQLVTVLNTAQQANFVAQRVVDCVLDGVPLHEIAVLYRAHFHSMDIQMELTRRRIPHEVRSGIRFFEQAHIKDVAAYLRILVNAYDEAAWKRVLGLYDGVGVKTAEKLWRRVSQSGDPLAAVFSEEFLKGAPKGAAAGLREFRATIKDLREAGGDKSPAEMVAAVLEGGYGEILRRQYTDVSSREEDLAQLARFSGKFDSLGAFLSELSLLTNAIEESEEQRVQGRDKVVLSTIHQAKGLEWSVVFLVSCADGQIPLAKALKEPGGEEEERRLFYVAATRAKDRLYICYPMLNYSRTADDCNPGPSRFIRELTESARGRKDCPFDYLTVR